MPLTPSQTTILANAIRQAAIVGSDAQVVAFATGTLAERAAMVKPFVQAQLAQTQALQANQVVRNAAESAALTATASDDQAVLALFP